MTLTEDESAQTGKVERAFQRITQSVADVQLDCNLGAWNTHNGEVLQARYARADSLLRATQVMLHVDPDDPAARPQEALRDLLTQVVSAFGLLVSAQDQQDFTPHK